MVKENEMSYMVDKIKQVVTLNHFVLSKETVKI